jgi:hypothetical protein
MSENKTLTVKINGVDEIIEYRTDLSFGEIMEIKKKTYKGKNPFDIEFDSDLYQRLIMDKAIVKVPFDHKDLLVIYKLEGDVVIEILTVLMDQFPLERFFKPTTAMLTSAKKD